MTNRPLLKKSYLKTRDLEKIKEQEIFRLQFSKSLEDKQKHSKIYNFLNSSLGLFLLSTIFITGLGNYISKRIENNKQKGIIRTETNKRLVELDNRLSQIDYLLENSKTESDSAKRSFNGIRIWRIIAGDVAYQATSQEFNKTPIIGVLSYFRYNTKFKKHYLETYDITMRLQFLRPGNSDYDYNYTKMTDSIKRIHGFLEEVRNENDIEKSIFDGIFS